MGVDDKGVPDISPQLPAEVRELVERVRSAAAGVEVLLVGGAVRDALLGQAGDTVDWDFATSLAPAELSAALPGAEVRDLDLGVVRQRVGDHDVSVGSYREEGGYTDRRHPDWVRFVADPAADARRRDFTINAIYFDPWRGRLIDPCAGGEDLRAGRLRTIGDPAVRFAEDPLRLLRAVRFAARAGLEIEPRTERALCQAADLLRELSAERVFDELDRAFTDRGRGRALRLLVECGLAEVVLPEVAAMDGVPQPPEYHPEGDVLTHVCLVLDQVPVGDRVLSWSAVLHDVGKPPTFERSIDRIRFSGHDQLSAQLAQQVLQRLRAPRALRDVVIEVCRDHIRFASLFLMKPGKRERWLRSPHFPVHLEFHRADCLGSHGDLSIYRAACEALRTLPPLPPEPLCGGADVLALGVPEGPAVGEILAELQSRLDEHDAPNRDTARALLRVIVEGRVKADLG